MTPGRIGRFAVERLAGQGGMGTVYAAVDEQSGERVAIKVLREPDPQAHARFAREAEALSLVTHPGVVRYVGHGRTESGEPYLIMQWIDGEDLAKCLQRGPLGVGAALKLCRALAGALATVHAAGVIHRDVKPHNVLLIDGDPARPVLVDFGVARPMTVSAMTATGAVIGTPQYMAPEQIQGGQAIDRRADLFALGTLLFECISGRPAFVAEHVMGLLAKILVERPPALAEFGVAASPALEQLVAALLEKQPSDRPASASDVAARLDACIEELAADGAEGDARPLPLGLTTRERRAVAVVMASGVSSVSGLGETVTPQELAAQSARLDELLLTHRGIAFQVGPSRLVVTFRDSEQATDQAARAARYAIGLGAAHPEASISLAVGWAQVERVPVGEVIDRAVALLERALPGRVLVDQSSAGLLDLRFGVIPRAGDFELEGELETEEPPRTLLGRATPCVGRERELAVLSASLDEVASEGVARAVLVSAPPGAGKSRLRHEFVERVRRRAEPVAVFTARAELLRAGSPLDLLARLVRAAVGISAGDSPVEARDKLTARLALRIAAAGERSEVAAFLGEIVGAPFPDTASARLANAREDTRLMGSHMSSAFLAWLSAECRAHPVVLVLEDLHWGDQQTVRFLDTALREHAHQPFLILAFARPEVSELFPSLWKARGLTELPLGALSPKACERLVRDVLGELDQAAFERIIRHADGNALYLEELIRAAAGGDAATLPVSVLAMVQSRLEALDARSRRLLRAASIFGEGFRTAGAEALVGEQAAAAPWVEGTLAELVEREVLVRRDHADVEYAFRHAVVREAAYAMLTEADRKLGHGLAGAWLEAHGESDALLLAQHYDRAGDVPAALRCFARAARQAVAKNDFEAALVHAQRAIDLGAADETLGEARFVRGKAMALLGRWAEAESELDAALASIPRELGERRMEVMRQLFVVGSFRQGSDSLRRAGAEAMVIAQSLGRSDLVAEAQAALAIAAHADADCALAVQRYREAVDRIGDRPSSVVGLSGILLYHAGLHEEAERVSRRMLNRAVEMQDAMTVVILSANIGLSLAAQGRYEEAREWFASARAEAERRGLQTLAARSISLAAGHRIDLYDLDGAAALADEVCEIGKRIEFSTPRISASIDLAFIALRRGRPGEAQSIIEQIASTVEHGAGFHGWLWRERVAVVRAEIDVARGDFSAALTKADASIEECRRHQRLKYRVLAHRVRARALTALGERERAVTELHALLEEAAASCDPAVRLRASLTLLSLARDEKAHALALASAGAIEAALPTVERSAFAKAFESELAGS